jgi:hypothetical protein
MEDKGTQNLENVHKLIQHSADSISFIRNAMLSGNSTIDREKQHTKVFLQKKQKDTGRYKGQSL